MRTNIIDFEASALKYPCYPIQVAVILEDGRTFNRYIRPAEKWADRYNWDINSENIHRIPMGLLYSVGHSVEDVARDLNEFIGDLDVFCDGGTYDVMWADELFETAKIKRGFRIGCVSELYDLQNGSSPMHVLKAKAVNVLGLAEHDALSDVQIIQTAVRWKQTDSEPK